MGTQFSDTEYAAQVFAEYVIGNIDENTPDNTLHGKATSAFYAYIRGVFALNDIYDIQTNDDYPQGIKDALSVMVIAHAFKGATPVTSIPMTFQAAWDAVNDIPDQYGGGTKEEFWQELNNRFPEIFPLNQDGTLSTPTFISSPASSPDYSQDDNPLPNEAPFEPVIDGLGDFGDATDNQSPLVLDLNGDGIELTDHNAITTTTFFDIDADGFAEQTAWVGADDGLLAIDINQNGRIDGASELFGSATVDGFAILAELDSNGDLIIDANDAAWSDLVIWKDANGDAVTQSGELAALSTYDIVSIDLAGVSASTQTISGNPISHESTFKYSNGTTGDIVDAWFVHDNVNSYDIGDYTFDEDTLWLPKLRGYGELPAFFIAMSRDSGLKTLVEDFADNWTADAFADQAALDSDIEDILFRWGGVHGVATDSRGPNIDARRLEFLEELFGEEWMQHVSQSPNPWVGAAEDLNQSWNKIFTALRGHLVFQSGGYELFAADTTYNPLSGEIEGSKDLVEDAINDLVTPSTEMGVDTEDYWINIARFLDNVKGLSNLTGTEEGWLDTAIQNADNTLSWSGIETAYLDSFIMPSGSTIYGDGSDDGIIGTSYDDEIYGLGGNDNLVGSGGNDVLEGSDGNDTLEGGTGNDTLIGGSDNDTLSAGDGGDIVYGGYGDDAYIYTSDDDVYSENSASGSDKIVLPSGITSNDLSFARLGDHNLLIIVDGLGTIEIVKQLNFVNNIHAIETIEFYDTSTLNLLTIDGMETHGTEAGEQITGIWSGADDEDTIYGYGGADELIGGDGDDVLDGGNGNDILHGNNGNDTYIASPGYDKIADSGTGNDTIKIPVEYAASDLTFLRIAGPSHYYYDGLILIEGLGQIELSAQFYPYGGSPVEQITFDNSDPTITLSSQVFETRGTSGNDTIAGITVAGSQDDILNGMEGNDYMTGGSGDDTYIFSIGTDRIYESSGSDTIRFWDGYDSGNISLYRHASTINDLTIDDNAGNTLRIQSHFYNSSQQVEAIEFYDSTTWNLLNMEIETHGTSGNDGFNGIASGFDASTDDTMYGYGGNDYLRGYEGADSLYGGDGADYLYGGNGGDVLYGGDGLDNLYGENGADIFLFEAASAYNNVDIVRDFDTGESDKLDLSDLLTGYNPVTDAITDFVEITTNGSNSLVKVDADGTGGGASFAQIATLQGITGLTDEAALETTGTLITA